MVTIIFISDEGEPVQLCFSKNEDLNETHEYGKWDASTNNIELNENGWNIFEAYRKEVRKLKPLLELLEKNSI